MRSAAPRLVSLLLVLGACSSTPGSPAPDPGRADAGASGGAGGVSSTGGVSGTGGVAGSVAGTGGASGGSTGGSGGGMPDAEPPSPTDVAPTDTTSPPDSAPSAQPVCPPGPFEAPKPGARENICPGFQVKYNWNEGPTWSATQKAFYFSNFAVGAAGPGDTIKYDPATNKCEIFIEGNGCNGLTIDRDGNMLGACHTPRALMKYDLVTKKGTVVVDMVEGKKLDSPNDVVTHRNGTIYFSNATYELGGRPPGLGSALLRVDPAGMVSVVARGGINPLGISPDQKRLYAMGGYWDLDDAGVPTKKNGGFTLGGDGIGVDCAGNVYTQTGAIISPSNQQIGSFPGGTNNTFGGEDGKTLLVVGRRNMHTVKMNLPGLP